MSPSAASSPVRTWVVGVLLFVGTLLLFSRAVPYGFLNYDDPAYVTNNAHVKAGLTWDGVVWAFTGDADYWHPLTWLSHMLDWQLYGDNARGHRLTSLLWHAFDAVLLCALLRRWTGAFWTSAFVAAVFAWHPLRVESVVWVTERKDVMSGAFFLLTLWAYTRYTELRGASAAPHGARAWRWYAATLGLFVAGLASKPMLVSLPLVLLVLDFWPLRRDKSAAANGALRTWGALALEKLPFFALSALVSWVTVRMQHTAGAFTLEVPLDARLGNAVVSVARYLGKLVWPFDLAVAYPHPGYWPAWCVAAALALALALTGAAWWQRATRPWLLAGWLWFLVVLAPASGVIQSGFQAMADRYSYLSLIGVVLAAALTWHGVAAVRKSWARFAPAIAVAILAGLAARTWNQQAHWRDPLALFEHALAVTERNDVAHALYAYTLLGEKRNAEAEVQAQRALALDPRSINALYVLAAVAEAKGRAEEATALLGRLLELKPSDVQSAHALGLLLLQMNRPADAAVRFRQVLKYQPDVAVSRLGLADAEARQGHTEAAVREYEAVLAAHPDAASGHNNFAILLSLLGRSAEAEAHFRTAVQLLPDDPSIRVNFGDHLRGLARWPEAEEQYARAVALGMHNSTTLFGLAVAEENNGHGADAEETFPRAIAADPRNPAIRRAWADALAKRRRFAEAIEQYGAAVELQPGDASHHAALGYALFVEGRREEAIAQWEEALRLDPEFPDLRRRLEALQR